MYSHFDRDVCAMFNIRKFPFVLFFKENKIYKYEGGLALTDLLEYLSADNFKNAPVYHENLEDFVGEMLGTLSWKTKAVRLFFDTIYWCEI